LVLTWFIDDLYHLFPRSTKIRPFPFASIDLETGLKEGLNIRWYVFEICNYLRCGIFAVIILVIFNRLNVHWLLLDVIKITILLITFSLFWFLILYNNPFYSLEIWIKFLVGGFIYLSYISIRWKNGSRNSRIFGRGAVRRGN
jgi:hypothetical protein